MKTILIVDDSSFMRLWLKKILSESITSAFLEAENGYKAIDMFESNKPNLVLMDITMPKLNGLEALQEIIKIDSNANVIMCSALGQQQLVLDALTIGAKDFIVKPHFQNLISIASKYI